MRRPDQHVACDKAVNLLKLSLPDTWIKREVSHDYGVDLEVEIVNGSFVTGQRLWMQVKGVQSPKVIEATLFDSVSSSESGSVVSEKKQSCIAFSMETKHLEYALLCDISYLLVVVNLGAEICYWLPVRDEVEMLLSRRNPMWRKQRNATVYLPLKNELSRGQNVECDELQWYSREPARIRSFWELQKNKRWFEVECQTINKITEAGLFEEIEREVLLREVATAFPRIQLGISIWEDLVADGMTLVADATLHNLKVAAANCIELLDCEKEFHVCKSSCIRHRCSSISHAMLSSTKIDIAYDMYRRMFLHTSDRLLYHFDSRTSE